MKPTLELPITLRTPNIDEIPVDDSVKERMELRKTANIVEGFKIFSKENNSESADWIFNFYAEININNSRLWELILELSNEFPNEISIIFNYIDEEPIYGKYSDKRKVLEFLSNYKTEIVSDTFIDIGLLFHTESELIELFIANSKYLQFWGMDKTSFLVIMKNFNLQETENMEFTDEYPQIREPLRRFKEGITDSKEFIELLTKEFA